MDIQIFAQMLNDKAFTNYKKMSHKYSQEFEKFLNHLEQLFYQELPLNDFDGNKIVFMPYCTAINQNAVKLLLKPQNEHYGIKAAEEEIIATSAIESIDFSRDSVRNILKGLAPNNEQENRILGIKHGFEFISDFKNKITEENIYRLYMMTVGDFLEEGDRLFDGNFYRHDTVYIVSDHIEHSGINHKKIPEYMDMLVKFINEKDNINDLIKAAIIHFYIAYIHPYFDGNGRMARLIHLWFLIQKGYQSALFVPFSSQIEKSRKAYYDAFTIIEDNKYYSKKIDTTPFICYFINSIYNKLESGHIGTDVFNLYEEALKNAEITEKETKLWQFVLSYYGLSEFSTKQLEKDFGNAAYATIRGFVLKFTELGLLQNVNYGARTKYRVMKSNF